MPQELKRKLRADDDDAAVHERCQHHRVQSDSNGISAFTTSDAADQPRNQLKEQLNGSKAALHNPTIESFAIPQLRFATESWQGMKPSNEDRHVTDATRFPGPVFGVFDGHGGVFTVEFLVRHLLKNMSSSLKQHVHARDADTLAALQQESGKEAQRRCEIETQLQLFQEQLTQVQQMLGGDDGVTATPDKAEGEDSDVQALHDQLTSAVDAMQDAIKQIDNEEDERREQFRTWVHTQDPHFKRAFSESFQRTDAQVVQKNPSRDGSTALLVWFISSCTTTTTTSVSPLPELAYYTINLGDCRAVLCRGGQGVPLTTDHKPSRPDEKHRILSAGGFVGTFAGIARVYSATGAGLSVQPESATYLAVSRAFGDRPLKVPTALVSCEPVVKRFTVEREDLFLVVACDGIWDVMSNQDAVNIGLTHFADAKKAADAIVKEAYRRGSSDNLTATVIQFGWQDGSSHLKQAQASNTNDISTAQHKPSPRFLQRQSGLMRPRMTSMLDSDASAAAAGETTENQEEDDDEEDEIDMFNL